MVEVIQQGHSAHGGQATEQYYSRGGSNLTATVVVEVIQQGHGAHGGKATEQNCSRG